MRQGQAAGQWGSAALGPGAGPGRGGGGGHDEFGGFAVESSGRAAAEKEESEAKEGGGDGWGDGDGWDDDFDASPAYPTLTAYDRNGVKVGLPLSLKHSACLFCISLKLLVRVGLRRRGGMFSPSCAVGGAGSLAGALTTFLLLLC